MRNNFAYLACVLVVLNAWAFGQTAVEKSSKPVAKQVEKAGEKSAKNPDKTADKPAGKPSDKPAEGGLKLGVSSEAEKLLDLAIAKIESLTQFRCDVRQVTEMLGYRFTADGQYAIGPEYRMLYELKVQLTDTTGTIKEVCDGRTHWQNQKIFDEQQLVKIDLKKMLPILDNSKFNKDLRDSLIRRLGFSGMVPLMKGLRESQQFETYDEEMLDDKPVYLLHGQWREDVINQASFRGQQLSLANLPPFMPNKSSVWIGREDGWLYKVELESTKKVLGSTTKITLEFLDPQIGVELPESLFIFEPPAGVRALDQTDAMFQNLNLILQQSQGTRTAASPTSTGNPTGDEKSKTKSSSPGSEPTKKPGVGLQP